MAALIALTAICLFAVGVAIIGAAALAIRREERNLTLTGAPRQRDPRGTRLTGLYVRAPRPTPTGDRENALV
jgi:hypothetical protein